MPESEKRAGEALRELTEGEGLSVGEVVEWCSETITVREATRLRRLSGPERRGHVVNSMSLGVEPDEVGRRR